MTTPTITIPSITLPSFVLTLLIAGLCGAVAQLLVGYTRGGCIASVLFGLVGALLGSWLAATLNLPSIISIFGIDVVWTIIGAALFVAVLSVALGWRRGGWRGWRWRSY
jgi:uncharacterized membrane protein YeaQ/YmgE (transglycosylase-associated protein family)